MEARLERLDREIEALAPQIEAALARAQQPGASPLAAKHYNNLVAEEKQLIGSRHRLQAQLLSGGTSVSAIEGRHVYSQHFGHPSEGINGRRKTYMTRRASLCHAIHKLLDTRGYVLITAPPQSGKTAILQLYADYIEQLGGESMYINASTVDGSFDSEFARICGGTLKELVEGGKSLTVLVDEAGAIYKQAESGSSQFWAHLKAFSAGPSIRSTPHSVRVVLAAPFAMGNDSYGNSTGLQPAPSSATWAASALPTPERQTVSAVSQQLNAPVHQATQNPMAVQTAPMSVMQQPQQYQAVQPVTPQQLPPQPTSTMSSPTKTPMNPDDPVAVITVLPSCHPEGASLQLAAEEYEELWSRFIAHSQLQLHDAVKNYILRVTGGQVGLVMVCLDFLVRELRNELRLPTVVTHNSLFKLSSDKFIGYLQHVRSLMHSKRLLAHPIVAQVTRMLLWARQLPLKSFTGSLYKTVHQLNKYGHLVIDADERWVAISSPLHWTYCYRELYSNRIRPHLAQVGDVKDLLVMVLERINPLVLEASMTLGRDGRLLEACWQFEVYRAATSVLRETVASTNVWGAKGYVDLYLPEPLCTALELTRDSDRWQEHLQRFEPPNPQASQPAGRYYPMIACGAVKHWAVVDFLSPPNQQQQQQLLPPPQQHAGLYSVRMLSWHTAEIWHMGERVVPHVGLAGTTSDAQNTALWGALRDAVHQAQGDQPPLPMEA